MCSCTFRARINALAPLLKIVGEQPGLTPPGIYLLLACVPGEAPKHASLPSPSGGVGNGVSRSGSEAPTISWDYLPDFTASASTSCINV